MDLCFRSKEPVKTYKDQVLPWIMFLLGCLKAPSWICGRKTAPVSQPQSAVY